MCLLVFPVSFQNLQALIDEVSGQLDLIELLTNQSYCRRPIFSFNLLPAFSSSTCSGLGLLSGIAWKLQQTQTELAHVEILEALEPHFALNVHAASPWCISPHLWANKSLNNPVQKAPTGCNCQEL